MSTGMSTGMNAVRRRGEWREGTSPSRSLRTVRDSLPSYGSHSPAFFCLGRSVGLLPRRVDLQTTVNCPAPSLRPRYRAFTATTGRSAPVPRIGTLALAVFAACGSPSCGQLRRPSLSGRQVLLFHASACDELTPPIHRAPSGPHTGSSPTEGPPWRAFVPGPPTDPGFDAIVVSFRCVSSGSHMFVFSSHTCPANSETSPAALTTPALDRRSLRWFGISACTATPEDLPPSLAQHGSCRRSSTSSSSLPFRTHVGAGNSAVVVDLPRCGPMLSPRVPNLVPIPGITRSAAHTIAFSGTHRPANGRAGGGRSDVDTKQQGLWCDEPAASLPSGQGGCDSTEQGPVLVGERWSVVLSVQDCELVAQHDDLKVLRASRTHRQARQRHEQPVQNTTHGTPGCRRIVPGPRTRPYFGHPHARVMFGCQAGYSGL